MKRSLERTGQSWKQIQYEWHMVVISTLLGSLNVFTLPYDATLCCNSVQISFIYIVPIPISQSTQDALYCKVKTI